ncbi:trimethylamine methyltransferase family protein [Syntrophaceticus schinkii]|uniref:Uncharacterized protein n=1 Tax=Syntrophaceticus schinkii TaxID=499207 RepID=A0A0B7MJ07_9FIRM|nr:trimethylamine methyltransferase family protein [Syntrophaceticus schinkii]CEO88183.1 hypothetical protein SSCH_1540001 [Syntrophaceticus schinkii]
MRSGVGALGECRKWELVEPYRYNWQNTMVLPGVRAGYTGASKAPDAQSGFEHIYNALLPALIGIDFCGTAGIVDNALVASYENLVIDNELSSIIQHTVRGLDG